MRHTLSFKLAAVDGPTQRLAPTGDERTTQSDGRVLHIAPPMRDRGGLLRIARQLLKNKLSASYSFVASKAKTAAIYRNNHEGARDGLTIHRSCQAGVRSHRRLSPPGAAVPDGGTPLDRCGSSRCSKRRAARPVAVRSRLAAQ